MTKTAKPTDRAIEAIAQALGEDPENIRLNQTDWAKLMKSGVVVRLHIRRWRAKTKLTLEDLGLGDGDKEAEKRINQIMDLGYKRLLPAKLIRQLDAIESSARKNLQRCSYQTHWGSLVAETAYEDWKANHEKWEAQYWEVLDYLMTNYDAVIRGLEEEYRSAAGDAFDRLSKLYPERFLGKSLFDREEFVDKFVYRVSGLIPSKEAVKASFGFTVDLEYIPLPSLLAEDLKQAQEVKTAMEQEREESALALQMRLDVARRAEAQKEELVGGFLKDVVSQMRETVYNATTDVLDSLKRNGNLQPRSVVQLKALMEQISSLNFYGDREIDKIIEPVRNILNRAPADRKIEDIEKSLRDIATVTRSTLLDLGESPRSKRSLGIADKPSPDAVKRARRSIGLPVTEEETAGPVVRQKRLIASDDQTEEVVPGAVRG